MHWALEISFRYLVLQVAVRAALSDCIQICTVNLLFCPVLLNIDKWVQFNFGPDDRLAPFTRRLLEGPIYSELGQILHFYLFFQTSTNLAVPGLWRLWLLVQADWEAASICGALAQRKR
jgi:hypothetical protein